MTLSVAGIFKEIATILLSSTVFGDELTPINVTGLCIALTGIGLYNYLKYTLLVRNSTSNNGGLLEQGHGPGQDYTRQRIQDEEDRCTEMGGGTVLPSMAKKGGQFSQMEDNSPDNSFEESHMSIEDRDKRRKREEEADMAGWHNSGFTRTGNGYDDGDSIHTE
jgi:solute carrier family 35 protein C2